MGVSPVSDGMAATVRAAVVEGSGTPSARPRRRRGTGTGTGASLARLVSSSSVAVRPVHRRPDGQRLNFL